MEEINNEYPVYTISTAADILGISVHTLRMYEREGLILPYKKDSGHRLYSTKDIDRIRCIRNVINESKISIAGIKTIYSLIPCWHIVNCSEEERHNCQFFNSHSQPCWMIDHKNNICASKDCRECEVYNGFSNCENIKDKLKELITTTK